MLTLGLDTSTVRGSVALGRDGVILGDRTLSVRATHSETVLPAIDELLSEAGLAAADLDAIVVGAGPGSFTGVRIAAALARGICFPSGTELHAYSSLAAIAMESDTESGRVCALLDARKDQVYAAGYECGESLETVFEPRASSVDELIGDLALDDWTLAGVVSAHQRERLRTAGARFHSDRDLYPGAAALIRLSWTDPVAGRIDDPAHWEPAYVRGSSAERRVTRD
jgi:tRNA threonylcarbamoyladenosine biosynthesis protein TsaB